MGYLITITSSVFCFQKLVHTDNKNIKLRIIAS